MPSRPPQEWIAVQRNPTSGRGAGRRELVRLLRRLQQSGFTVRLFSRRERLQAVLADPERRSRLRCIVAAGGDGTVGDVVNRYPGLPVAVLPLGTENLLARYLGIPRSGEFVAEMIRQGAELDLDVARAEGRRFLLMASAGFDAEVVRLTDARRSGNITKLSYLQPIWSAIRTYPYPELSVLVDDDPQPVRGRLAVVCNIPAYALRLPVAREASPTDGLLELRVFERGSTYHMIRYLYHLSRGRHEALPDVICRQGRQFRISSEPPVPVQIDGDPAGQTPVTIGVDEQPVRMVVPETFLHAETRNIA